MLVEPGFPGRFFLMLEEMRQGFYRHRNLKQQCHFNNIHQYLFHISILYRMLYFYMDTFALDFSVIYSDRVVVLFSDCWYEKCHAYKVVSITVYNFLIIYTKFIFWLQRLLCCGFLICILRCCINVIFYHYMLWINKYMLVRLLAFALKSTWVEDQAADIPRCRCVWPMAGWVWRMPHHRGIYTLMCWGFWCTELCL